MKTFTTTFAATFVASLAMTGFAQAYASTGKASYYGGRGHTASGQHVGHMTAAHKTLPFGTLLRVTNLSNQRSAIVTVNDRGPFVRGRIVDVSAGAASVLGMRGAGVAPVRIEVVAQNTPRTFVEREAAPSSSQKAPPAVAPLAPPSPFDVFAPSTNASL